MTFVSTVVRLTSLYRQLQPSAAEPAVSWCQVADQRTSGHTAARTYTPPPYLHFSLAPCSSYLLVTAVDPNRLVILLCLPTSVLCGAPPVFMSPVHLSDKRESRSAQVYHLFMLTALATCNGQTVSQRREKEIICGLKQNTNNIFMISYKTFICPVKKTRTPNSSQGQKQTLDKNTLRSGVGPVGRCLWRHGRGREQGKSNRDINAASDRFFLSSLVGGRLKVKMIGLVLLTILGAAGSTR